MRVKGYEQRLVEIEVDRNEAIKSIKREIFGSVGIPIESYYNNRGVLVKDVSRERSHSAEDMSVPVAHRLNHVEDRVVRAIIELQSAVAAYFSDLPRESRLETRREA